jgi:hypothetical protein
MAPTWGESTLRGGFRSRWIPRQGRNPRYHPRSASRVSSTSMIGPVSPNAAICRNNSLIVSVLTTMVSVRAISWRVTAFHALKTLNL